MSSSSLGGPGASSRSSRCAQLLPGRRYFIHSYEGNEWRYTPDGVHLTDEQLHKYGLFIGKAAALRYVALKQK